MTIAYFDCFSGVAGDMVLGALLDAGMPLVYLKKNLNKVNIGKYKIEAKKEGHSICGTNFKVYTKSETRNNGFYGIVKMIQKSHLSKPVKIIACQIYEKIARAEAKIHDTNLDHVHFHEVGALDSLVDVIGAAIGFDYFGFDSIFSSPIPMTCGRVGCSHGVFPVPAPATLEILKNIPLESSHIKGEIVTPTGAAILSVVVNQFGECPIQKVSGIGYGFGDKKIPGVPNALRLIIGEGFPVVVIETNIDDMNPQIFNSIADKLFEAGAVDVDLAPIQMKKFRPAIKLSAIVPWEIKDKTIDIILKNSTSFGVRYYPVERKVLQREIVIKKTKLGNVRFKIGCDVNGKEIKRVPEFEDVKRLAKKKGLSILSAYQKILNI